MKDVKYRMESLCIYDYRGVEQHLSAMASKGWRLEKAGPQIWKYRRAEPAQVRYAVTYSIGASQFNPGPTEGQRSLEELCAAAGWRKVCDWFQMQIFCTEDESAVSLETDESIRLENIHRAMKKNFLPTSLILLVLSLLMSASFLYSLISVHLRLFETNTHLFTGTLFLLVVALQIYTLLHYYLWRRRSRRSVAEGGSCVPLGRGYRRLNAAGLGFVAALSVLYLLAEFFSGRESSVLLFVIYIPLFILVSFLVRRTTVLLRSRGVSKGWNIAGTLAVDVLLAFVMIGGLIFWAVHSSAFTGGSGETYTYDHMEWDVHPREDVPLTLEQLTGEAYGHISRNWRSEGSIFLPSWSYREWNLTEDAAGRQDYTSLSYTIYEPKGQRLYAALVEDLLDEDRDQPVTLRREYRSEDAASWGADAAYRRWYLDGASSNHWVLCWPGRVVELSMDWTPTDGEKAVIQSCLSPEA